MQIVGWMQIVGLSEAIPNALRKLTMMGIATLNPSTALCLFYCELSGSD
jgi:hypothetical protein